jgi:hypothetical protein
MTIIHMKIYSNIMTTKIPLAPKRIRNIMAIIVVSHQEKNSVHTSSDLGWARVWYQWNILFPLKDNSSHDLFYTEFTNARQMNRYRLSTCFITFHGPRKYAFL